MPGSFPLEQIDVPSSMLGWLSSGASFVGRLGLRGQGGVLVAVILEVGDWGVLLSLRGTHLCHACGDYAGAEPFGFAARYLGNWPFFLTGLEGAMILTSGGLSRVKEMGLEGKSLDWVPSGWLVLWA